MAGLVLCPASSNWMVLLVLLLSGEPVSPITDEDMYLNPKGSACSRIWQNPRFVARKRGSVVKMQCHIDSSSFTSMVTWFRKQETDKEAQKLSLEQGHIQQTHNDSIHTLIIQGVQFEDNGIYFCQQECPGTDTGVSRGCGTELRVMGVCQVDGVFMQPSIPTSSQPTLGVSDHGWRSLWPQSTQDSCWKAGPGGLLRTTTASSRGGVGDSTKALTQHHGPPSGFSTLAQLKRRNTLKDGIIMIQTLLIILFIIVPIFLLLDKDDSKAGMEEDHTYEGLDIDQTATYEDIVTLRTGEVKWSVGEHPGQE